MFPYIIIKFESGYRHSISVLESKTVLTGFVLIIIVVVSFANDELFLTNY